MAASKKRSRAARPNRNSRPKNKVQVAAPAPLSGGVGIGRILLFGLFLVLAFFSFTALITYVPGQEVCFPDLLEGTFRDSDIRQPACCGKSGATFAVVAFYFFGGAAYLIPLFLVLLSVYMLRSRMGLSLYWKCTQMFFLLASGTLLLSLFFGGTTEFDSMVAGAGGGLGKLLSEDICEPV